MRAVLLSVMLLMGEDADPCPQPSAECYSCGEHMPRDECPASERPCGHHCNHSWTQDVCDWCGAGFGEEPA